jgi:hypothetical protein
MTVPDPASEFDLLVDDARDDARYYPVTIAP